MNKLFKYIGETRTEMKHVAWPTQTQTIVFTALVILISILTAVYLGIFDFSLTKSLESSLNVLQQQNTTQLNSNLPDGLDITTTKSNGNVNISGVEVTPVQDANGSKEVTDTPQDKKVDQNLFNINPELSE